MAGQGDGRWARIAQPAHSAALRWTLHAAASTDVPFGRSQPCPSRPDLPRLPARAGPPAAAGGVARAEGDEAEGEVAADGVNRTARRANAKRRATRLRVGRVNVGE